MIENYQNQINKIIEILQLNISKFTTFCPISEYNPKILKSGISKFDGTKSYIDTSNVEGINNILGSDKITFMKRPSRANIEPVISSVYFAKMKASNKIILCTDEDNDIFNDKILSTGFIGIRGTDELPLSLLFSFVISKNFMKQRNQNSVGTTMEGINNETFLKIEVPYLTKDERYEFDINNMPLIDCLSILRRKISNLKLQKELLLNKYF